MRNRITYSLKRERHVAPVASAAATNFPTAVRQLIRRVENHSKQAEFAQCAKALAELVGLYEETADFKLIEKYATDLVNIALKKLKGGSSHRIASAALLSLGKAHIGRQEFDKAINVLEQYAKYYGRLETPEENRNVSYTSQFQLALAFLKRGEYKQDHFDVTCLQDFDTAYKKLIILQSSFDMGGASPQLRCDVYMNLGVSGGYIGKTEQALTCFQRSLKIALSQNFLESVANAYFNLSNLFRKAGDLTKAYEYLKKDLGINREMNNIEGCLRSQYEMALLLREMHDYDEAITVTNSFIDFAKTISDNESRDKGTAFLRVLEECISQTKRIRVLTDRLANHRRQRGGKREEFGILKDIASLRMSLEQFEAALKDYETLEVIMQKLPVSAEDRELITRGLADALFGLKEFDRASEHYRTILKRCSPLTVLRAEVLYKLSDCLSQSAGARCDQITAYLTECDRIGIHLHNLQLQHEAQTRLLAVYTRFQFFDKAATTEMKVAHLARLIDQEGVAATVDDEEEEDEIGGDGDACDDDEDSISDGSDEDASRWISENKKGKSRRGPNGGRRTSAVVKKLDLTADDDDISSSPEVRTRSISRKILPLQPTNWSQTQGSSSSSAGIRHSTQTSKRAIVISSDEDDSGSEVGGLTHQRQKTKRKNALELLKEKKRRKDGNMSPEDHAVCDDGPSILPSRAQSHDIEFDEMPDLPPPQYFVGNYVPPAYELSSAPTSSTDAVIVSSASITAPTMNQENDFNFDTFPGTAELMQIPVTGIAPPVVPSQPLDMIPNTPLENIVAQDGIITSNDGEGIQSPARPSTPTQVPKASKKTPNTLKVRVQVGSDVLMIPCSTVGTPKTVRWLQNEVVRRYKGTHRKSVQIDKLVVHDEEDEILLFKDDLVTSVLNGDQRVHAVLSSQV